MAESLQKPDIGSVLNGAQKPLPPIRRTSTDSDASFVSASSQAPPTSTPISTVTSTPSMGTGQSPPPYVASRPSIPSGPPPVTTGPTRIPLTAPSPKARQPHFPVLTPQQQAMYAQVLSTVSTWSTVPDSTLKGAKNSPVTEDERMWLTRECLLRYLRATKWKVPDALKRLQGTLSWRREYGADTFTADYISPENETGKQVIQGYDMDARPCLYLSPGKQNTKMSDRQIHHLSWMLDRTLDMLPPGQETTCLLINFKGAASGNVPTVGQAKAVLNILQNHNPERLGRALISDLPWYVSTFFKLISPFIDPVTREKMKFNEPLRTYVPPEQLWNQNGGELDFEYEHDAYWAALDAETKRRRAAYKERWIAAGKKIGEYEEYLRGGQQKCIREILEEAEKASSGVLVDGSEVDIGKLKV